MMRRAARFAFALCALSPLAVAQTAPKKRAKSATTRAQTTSASQQPFIPIPGVGGALPPRRSTAPSPALKPLAPWIPGAGPAPVGAPGQGGALPGVFGLRAQPFSAPSRLIYGVSAAWGDEGGLAGWDKDGGARARRLVQLVRGCGATNLHIRLRWSDIEPVRGKYEWGATDHFLRFVGSLGLPLVAMVDSPPAWASAGAIMDVPAPGYYADLGAFAFALARRYRSRLPYVEFMSEPDRVLSGRLAPAGTAGTAEPPDREARTYTALLRVFTGNFKRGDPGARVAVGGLGVKDPAFLMALYHAGARPWFDAVALHAPSGGDVVDFAWIDRCRAVMAHAGDAAKPVWITQWGWPTAPADPSGITELHQARLVREGLAAMRARPYIAVADYRSVNDWRARERDPASVDAAGLATYNLMPKPGLVAFREMATGTNIEAAARYARVGLTGGLPLVEEAGVRAGAVNVTVEAGRPGRELPPLWTAVSQGYEPDVPHLVAELPARLHELGTRVVRFDPFPTTDLVRATPQVVGTRSVSTTSGAPVNGVRLPGLQIDWRYTDAMVEAIEQAGAKPMFVFATMPTALSSPSGNPHMPRSLDEWSAFVQSVVRRYNGEQRRGIRYWELSSEPNRGDFTVPEWLQLYDTFARAVIAADPSARVGGPGVAGYASDWLAAVADHCAQRGVPLGFLSWHAYDQSPAEYARQAADLRATLRRTPELANTELMVSEWNASAAPSELNDDLAGASHDASVIEQLADSADAGPLGAPFYELREGPAPRRPQARLSGRWGLLTADDRPKPAFNLFRLLNGMAGRRVPTASEDTDVHAIATRSEHGVAILLWSDPAARRGSVPDMRTVADDLAPSTGRPDVPVHLRVRGLPWSGDTAGELWTIDAQHGDIATNAARSELARAARFDAAAGEIEVPLVVSPNSVSRIDLAPTRPPALPVTLEASHYAVYEGSPFSLIATVRNRTGRPAAVDLALGGRDMAGPRATRRVTLATGEAKTVAFVLSAPLGAPEGQRFYEVTARAAGAGDLAGRSGPAGVASIAVKFAAPLSVRATTGRADVSRPGALPDQAASVARFDVALDNRSDTTLRLGVVSGHSAKSVILPRRESAVVPVLVAPPSNSPGVYEASIRVLQAGRSAIDVPVLVGVPALCPFSARPIRANGDLSEWRDTPQVSLSGGAASAVTAQFAAMWDSDKLYLAVTVSDAAPPAATQSAPATLPQVQIALWPAGADSSPPVMFEMDSRAWGSRLFGGHSPGPQPRPRDPIGGAQVGTREEAGRTVYEVAIPWRAIPSLRPRSGALAALYVRINDTSGQGRPPITLGAAPDSASQRYQTLRLTR